MRRKIWVILFLFLFVILSGQAGSALKSFKNLYIGIITNQPRNFDKNYQSLRKKTGYWGKALDFIDLIPELTGINGQKTYFVLFQNNMELRPTGGFMGSYAKLKFINGGLADLVVQDIYVPDGQIAGHVDPPIPIQMAFGQGWFRLRDANWDPDFPGSAQTIAWFFAKGNEEKADGLIAVNLNFVQELFKVTGAIDLIDYKLKVDQTNFYQVAQEYAEKDFFAGSTQKANIMSALVKAMIAKLTTLNLKQTLGLAKIIYKNLQEKQILLYSADLKAANFLKSRGWDGAMTKPKVSGSGFSDYFYLVESNLGVNKANLYVQRQVGQKVTFLNNNSIHKSTKITYRNESKYNTPIKPSFWGGDYVNFLRIYYPALVKNVIVKIDGEKVREKDLFFEKKEDLNLGAVGFFVKIPAQTEVEVSLDYEMVIDTEVGKNVDFSLTIQKQSGIDYLPYKLSVIRNKKEVLIFEKWLRRDTEIEARF